MRLTCLVTAAVAMLFTTATTSALALGSGQATAMACHQHAADGATACCDLFFNIDRTPPPAPDADLPPVRQTAVVWFERPVRVGENMLMGKYIIEHDTDRQARGEPCTHIYAANNRTRPVVAFHCTHLERDERVQKNTVVLQSLADGMRRFVEFQFAGDNAAHGYPTGR